MNLKSLKERLRKVTAVTWQGETIYLRKVSATDGVTLVAMIKDLASKELNEEQDRRELIAYYSAAVAKSLANQAGELELDSDAGREALGQLPFSELNELATLVLTHNGFTAEKKSTPISNSSLSGSALPSETETTPTQMPCTLS